MKRSSNATRHLAGCLLLILGMSLAVGACGDDQPAGQGGTTGTSSDSGGTGGSGGAGGAGGAGGEGGAGGAGGSTGTPCQQFCDLRAPVCADDDDSTCLTKCDFEYDEGVCKAEWAAAIDCVLTSGELVCNNGSPTAPDACDPAFLTYVSCLATSCYKDLGACNPLLDSCPAGRVCDPGDGAFFCRSASSPVPRGDDCDGSPACEHGTTCFFGRCTAFCCSDSDCGFGSCKYQATFAGPDGNIPLTLCDPY